MVSPSPTSAASTFLLPRHTLSSHAAALLGQKGLGAATLKGWNMTVCVVDAGGEVLFLQRMDGAMPASAGIAVAKARTAVAFARETKMMEGAVRSFFVGGLLFVDGDLGRYWLGK